MWKDLSLREKLTILLHWTTIQRKMNVDYMECDMQIKHTNVEHEIDAKFYLNEMPICESINEFGISTYGKSIVVELKSLYGEMCRLDKGGELEYHRKIPVEPC